MTEKSELEFKKRLKLAKVEGQGISGRATVVLKSGMEARDTQDPPVD